MTRTLRRLVLAGVVLGGGLALTACDSTAPGAAAIVGPTTISTDHLATVTNRALDVPALAQKVGGQRADFQRQELGRLIEEELSRALAGRLGVSVTAGEIDQQVTDFEQQAGGPDQLRQQAAASGIPPADLRDFVRNVVLERKISDALVADVPVSESDLRAAYQANIDSYDQVHAAHILVNDKALADQILREVKADPSSFAALAKRYSTDTASKDNGGDLGWNPASAYVQAFSKPVFAAKPGSFIEVHTQYGWHVVHVIAHRTETLAQATPDLRRQLLQNQAQQRLSVALAAEAKRLGVHVNPRFGSWDAGKATVAAPASSVVSPAPGSTGS